MFSLVDTALSVIFSLLILLHVSWFVLLALPEKRHKGGFHPPVSVVIPAHNEESAIESTLRSVLDSEYEGGLDVIVVDDGSKDKTVEIVKRMSTDDSRIRVIRVDHGGKANAINMGFKQSAHGIIVVLDADSEMGRDAISQMVAPFSDKRIGGVSGIIRAKVGANPLTWFQDFEYIQSSVWRALCNRINGTYIFPGFAAFRGKAFKAIGGFQRDTFSEDFDIGLRLKKEGYMLGMTAATMYTSVPQTLSGLIRQRTRWGRGTIQVIRKHKDMLFNPAYGSVGFYGIPTQLYWYIHCFVYIPIFIYQVTEGYFRYFLNKGVVWSFDVFKYFFSWVSVYGIIEYSYKTFNGVYEKTTLFLLLFTMFVFYLGYNLFVLFKFAKPRLYHFFVIFFFFPYSLSTLIMHAAPAFSEILRPTGGNMWEKSK